MCTLGSGEISIDMVKYFFCNPLDIHQKKGITRINFYLNNKIK